MATAPYPVSLYDPPVEAAPDYGDEDAPKRQDLSFVEWLTLVAREFELLGNLGGVYLAGVVRESVELCKKHDIDNPDDLVRFKVERAKEDHRCLMAALETPL